MHEQTEQAEVRSSGHLAGAGTSTDPPISGDGDLADADLELLAALEHVDPEGPAWKAIAEELARYGFTVIRAWLRSGAIFRKCAENNHKLDSSKAVLLTEQDIEDIAVETVARALTTFHRRVIKPRRWRTGGTASLASWFVKTCTMEFPNQWRYWLRQNATNDRINESAREQAFLASRSHLSAPPLSQRLEVEDLALELAPDPTTREILILRADGYRYGEIAEILGLSETAVSQRIHRLRRDVQGRKEESR